MVERKEMRKEAQAPFNHVEAGIGARDKQIAVAREVAEWRRRGEAIQALLAAGIVPPANFTEPPSLSEQDKGISLSRPVLVAAALGLLAGAACAPSARPPSRSYESTPAQGPILSNTPGVPEPFPTQKEVVRSREEQRVEQGWDIFKGIGYEVHFPLRWKATDRRLLGTTYDLFGGLDPLGKDEARVAIYSVPFEKYGSIEKFIDELVVYINPNRLHLSREQTTVAGRKAEVIIVPRPMALTAVTHQIVYLSPNGKDIWSIQIFYFSPSGLENAKKMANTFRFTSK